MSGGLFAKHEQKALEWINQIDESLGWSNQNHSLDALRAVLHQLRDNLPIAEAANLGAQLPLIIKGIYFEGWRPSQVPLKERDKAIFCSSVKENLEQYMRRSFEDQHIEKIIESIFETLASRIDEGEIAKLQNIVPWGLKDFLDNALNMIFESQEALREKR